jgi:hypothetical protein
MIHKVQKAISVIIEGGAKSAGFDSDELPNGIMISGVITKPTRF